MYVGLTYDLRGDYLALGYDLEQTAEFDRPDTITALETALQRLGHDTDRIGNVRALVERLAAGRRWDLVFNIAEGLHGFGREAQVPALLDAYGIPYTFSDPLVMSVTLHKGFTKQLLRDGGLPTPEFCLVEDAGGIDAVRLPFPLFAKPVAEGTGKGVNAASIIHGREQLQAVCYDLLERFRQPVLVETFLPGRELTVGIVGTGRKAAVLGVLEVILRETAEQEVYSYDNKELCEERVIYEPATDGIAQEAAEIALAAWRRLGGRDGGRVDLRCDAVGRPQLLEINALPGLHPEHSDLPILCNRLGIDYQSLIGRITASALERCPKRRRGIL